MSSVLFTLKIQVIKFYIKSACYYKFNALTIEAHLHTLLPKAHSLFLIARGRSKENLSISGVK